MLQIHWTHVIISVSQFLNIAENKGTFMQLIKRNYKDTVFCDLFSDKGNALSLYNALNKTNYTDTEELEIVTLSEVI